jgi:hypothetical protein
MQTNVVPAVDLMTCKGTTIKAALAFIEHRGVVGLKPRVLARMPEESRRTVSGMVLPTSKLPLQVLVDLCEAIDSEMGCGDLALCWDIGSFAADFEVNLIHKTFLSVLSLDFWFRMASSTWTMYYSRGKLVAEGMSKTGGRLRLDDFDPISKAVCFRFGGWVKRVVELSRLRNVELKHTQCVLDGHSSCVWDGTWTS